VSLAGQDYEKKVAELREEGIVPIRSEITAAVAVASLVGTLAWIGSSAVVFLFEWKTSFATSNTITFSSESVWRICLLIASPGLIVLLASLAATLFQTRFFFRFSFFRNTKSEHLSYAPLPLYMRLLFLLAGALLGLFVVSNKWKSLWRALYSPDKLLSILGEVWGSLAVWICAYVLICAVCLWLRQRMQINFASIEKNSH
jgi:flagellar biosynthesis protein FlhB